MQTEPHTAGADVNIKYVYPSSNTTTNVIIGDKCHNAKNLLCDKPYNATNVKSEKHNNLTKVTNVTILQR